MVIIIWMSLLFIISFVIAFIYAPARKIQESPVNSFEEIVDIPIENLKIEKTSAVSSVALSLRGSWRLAQNAILEMDYFILAKSIEYSKKL